MNQNTTKSDSSVDIIRDRLVEDIFNLEIILNQCRIITHIKKATSKIMSTFML